MSPFRFILAVTINPDSDFTNNLGSVGTAFQVKFI